MWQGTFSVCVFPGLFLAPLQRQPTADTAAALAKAEDAQHDDRLPILSFQGRLLRHPCHRHWALAALPGSWFELSCRSSGHSDQVTRAKSKVSIKLSSKVEPGSSASTRGTWLSLLTDRNDRRNFSSNPCSPRLCHLYGNSWKRDFKYEKDDTCWTFRFLQTYK